MAKLTKEEIIASLKEMTVLELNELVKAVEEEFGVTAAAPVAAPVAPSQPVYVAPAATAKTADGKPILILGIVAVACCVFYFFSLASIICGAIGLSKAKKFLEEQGQLYGVAKVGKYLSLGGLIGGCVITGIEVFYVLMMIITLVAEAAR